MSRLVAVVLAVAMVVGAIIARRHIDQPAVTLRLTCSTELADACRRLGSRVRLTVEPAGTTADRLAALAPGADAGLDGWLVAGPWPAMVDAARAASARDPLFAGGNGSIAAVARSPLAYVVETHRAAAVRQACVPLSWGCIGGIATKRWDALGGPAFATFGMVKLDLPNPATDGDGLAALAAMSADVFRGRDFSPDDEQLRALLNGLRRVATDPGGDAVTTVLTAPAALDSVATTEAETFTVLDQAANRDTATVLYPADVVVEADVGVVGHTGAAAGVERLLRGPAGAAALAAARWKPASSPPAGSALDPGVMAALRAAWQGQ